jgi:hypothetical protein
MQRNQVDPQHIIKENPQALLGFENLCRGNEFIPGYATL